MGFRQVAFSPTLLVRKRRGRFLQFEDGQACVYVPPLQLQNPVVGVAARSCIVRSQWSNSIQLGLPAPVRQSDAGHRLADFVCIVFHLFLILIRVIF